MIYRLRRSRDKFLKVLLSRIESQSSIHTETLRMDQCVPTTPTLKDLSNELHSVVNWHSLGVKLGVKDHELTTIEKNSPGDNERCKHETLSRWLRNAKNPTWKAVADALQQMGELTVALNIRKKYYGSSPTPPDTVPTLPDPPSSSAVAVAQRNIQMIKAKYSTLVTSSCRKLRSRGIDIQEVQTFLITMYSSPSSKDGSEMVTTVLESATNLDEIFRTIGKYGLWDYLNYYLLQSIIEEFACDDDELNGMMEQYQVDLTGHILTLEIQVYLDAINPIVTTGESSADGNDVTPLPQQKQNLFRKLSVKVKVNVTECTLKYVSKLWQSLTKQFLLPQPATILHNIAEGCVCVTWLIPTNLVEHVTRMARKTTTMFATEHILRVMLEKQCIYTETEHLLLETKDPLPENEPPLMDTRHRLLEIKHPLPETELPLPATKYPLLEINSPLLGTNTQSIPDTEHPLMDTEYPILDSKAAALKKDELSPQLGVQVADGSIEAKFTTLLTNVCTKMMNSGIDAEDVCFFVVTSFPPGDVVHLPPTALTEIFTAITHHCLWDYFHYSPLERIVNKFGANDPEMEKWVQDYKNELRTYTSRMKITDYTEATFDGSIAKFNLRYCCPVEWKITFADSTLQSLADMWESFSAHYLKPDPPSTCLLKSVRDDSTLVTWLIPSHLIPQIIKKVKVDTRFLQKHGIWNVTVADQCIYDEQEAIDNTRIAFTENEATTHPYSYGRFPSITSNSSNVVVAVRNSLTWFTLKYRVGVISEGDTINWGQEEKFGYGYFSRVSLNNNNMVVEVHASFYKRTVSYRVGKVNVDEKRIDWGQNDDFGKGRAPAVALTDSGSVVVVYENAYGFYKSYYRVGTLNTEQKRIDWVTEVPYFYGKGLELSVAMNNDGTVIEVHRFPKSAYSLRCTVGRLEVDNQGNILGTIDWSNPETFSHGFYPFVSLSNDGKVVEVHQSVFLRRQAYRTGITNREAKTLHWSNSQHHYGLGWAPVVALNDHNKVIECHETNSAYKGNSLWYKIGTLTVMPV